MVIVDIRRGVQDDDVQLLEFLESSASLPGNSGVVTAASPDGTVTIVIDGNHIGVGAFASERILVSS